MGDRRDRYDRPIKSDEYGEYICCTPESIAYAVRRHSEILRRIWLVSDQIAELKNRRAGLDKKISDHVARRGRLADGRDARSIAPKSRERRIELTARLAQLDGRIQAMTRQLWKVEYRFGAELAWNN